jgi:RNA recognition motif-containing protein
MNLYVGNVSYDASEDDLATAFGEFGEVSKTSIITDRVTGRSRGFGFVEMPNGTEAQAAVEAMNGKEFLGRRLTVSEARPRPTRGGAGGGGRGGPRRRDSSRSRERGW